MTLQKLYEQLVIKTFENAESNVNHPLNAIANNLSDIKSFDKLIIELTLNGSGITVPKKANFKKFGESYLIQSLLFITKNLKDEHFLETFLTTITKYKETSDLISDDFKTVCYDIYIESITINTYISRVLGGFLIKHCQENSFYDDFWSIAHSTGIIPYEISFKDFLKTRQNFS